MLKHDSTRYPSLVQTPGIGPEWIEPEPADPGFEPADVDPSHSQADLPIDLRLDMRLHEILREVRLATAASGAVIALACGDKMVCRATIGDKAPSVGVCLNTRSGLSGACVQTREMQLCDDALADPRVNRIACRDLEIRSIVVLPVLDGEELWGVLEVFSSAPRAFNDSDLQALQALSRKISDTLHEATEDGSGGVGLEAFSRTQETDSTPAKPLEPEAVPASEQQDVGRRDYRTGTLTVAVLALAVLLGWMVGRVGWTMAVNRAPAQIPMTSEEAQATAQVTPGAPTVPPPQEAAANPSTPVASKPRPSAAPRPALKPKATPIELNGGLVVYEHGKVVFRMESPGKESPPQAEPAAVPSGAIQNAATREDDGSTVPAAIPSPSANSYLIERVEPTYPEAAREQHIQGPVVLNVLVGTSGLVRETSVVTGDPLLARAAIDAVRQWRFNPHQLKGKAVEFETRITVNFALPE
jgi:TonB family protein